MGEQMSQVPAIFTLDYLQVSTGTSTVPTATVRLKKDGKVFQDSACGDGPVDATLKTIDRITGRPGDLRDYSIQAVTRGEDAVGEVSMTVAFGKDYVSAKAASTDIVEASAKAYLNALNSHLFTRSAGKTGEAGRAARRGPATVTDGVSSRVERGISRSDCEIPHAKRVRDDRRLFQSFGSEAEDRRF